MTNKPIYSPHITIYQPQYSSISSIINRISVVILLVYLYTTLLFYADSGLFFFINFNNMFANSIINLILIVVLYHALNSIKKLFVLDTLYYTDLEKIHKIIIILIICVVFLIMELSR